MQVVGEYGTDLVPPSAPATGPPPLGPSPRRGRLPPAVTVPLWAVVIALLVVAAARVVIWDAFQPFAVLNDGTAFLYLPAWIAAVVAGIGRHWLLAAAALVVVAAQVIFMVPELTAAEPLPTWAFGAPTLRLLDANVYEHNPSMDGYVRQIDTLDPQLVTLEEATPDDVAQLDASGALALLPYRLEISRYDPWAFLVASHYPISEENAVYVYGRPLIVQLAVHLPSGPIELWVVHTVAPLPSSFSQWKGQLDVLDQAVRSRGTAGLLMVGDFNGTWGSRGFRRLLDDGLTDGAAARGDPFAMTWSQEMGPIPPLVRIDHVLTGSGLAVSTFSTGAGVGSDHRDLVATVAVDRRHGQ